MKWITRRSAHVDRTACPWLIKKFIDSQAEFVFVAPDADLATLKGHTFDMRGAEYAHGNGKCTFQVMLERHDLCGDAALVELGRIVGDADVPPSRTRRHESAGLDAIMRGFQLGVPDDHEKLRLTAPVYANTVRTAAAAFARLVTGAAFAVAGLGVPFFASGAIKIV